MVRSLFLYAAIIISKSVLQSVCVNFIRILAQDRNKQALIQSTSGLVYSNVESDDLLRYRSVFNLQPQTTALVPFS